MSPSETQTQDIPSPPTFDSLFPGREEDDNRSSQTSEAVPLEVSPEVVRHKTPASEAVPAEVVRRKTPASKKTETVDSAIIELLKARKRPNGTQDEAEHFLLSLAPQLRRLPPITCSAVKVRMQMILHEAEFGSNLPSFTTAPPTQTQMGYSSHTLW